LGSLYGRRQTEVEAGGARRAVEIFNPMHNVWNAPARAQSEINSHKHSGEITQFVYSVSAVQIVYVIKFAACEGGFN